jgi:rod shape-determining protein MreC
MPSPQGPISRRLRPWLVPGAGLLFSLGVVLLPFSWKAPLAAVLERTVFLPYRFAVGWGPRSLLAQHRAGVTLQERTRGELTIGAALEATRENSRLRGILGFRRRSDVELLPAVVISRGRGRFGDLLVIEPADPAVVQSGMVVISSDGLLGRVRARDGGYARVECLTSLETAVSVTNQRTREGGILKWDPLRGGLAIGAIPSQSDWQPGDRVVTSGLGLAFPGGILVGWVCGHRAGRGGLLQSIEVRPAAQAARAQEVFLLRWTDTAWPTPAERSGTGLSAFFPPEPARLEAGAGRPPRAAARPEPEF